MFVVVLSWLFAKNFRGLAIYPFIFLREKTLKENQKVINHEKIHLRQQIEMLWVFFFIWYGIEFLVRWFQYKNTTDAYFNISFEKEAYAHEKDFEYLAKRKFWSFRKYL
jgi:polyferredoxin